MKIRQARKILKNIRVYGLYDYYRISTENKAFKTEKGWIVNYLKKNGVVVKRVY